ncbi:MAG: class II fumarate hydratase, partial [Ketobacter sp.]
METRTERDALGKVEVPATALWGAQTQRSLQNFPIGDQHFPAQFIFQYALLKKAAALANTELGKLDAELAGYIVDACDEVMAGQHRDQFPLSVWQTGSGTQTNMNLNEVISNRANELAGNKRGTQQPIHPNDHVNMSQSSNDSFPTVMHMTVVHQWYHQLSPVLTDLLQSLENKQNQFKDLIKSGRTHLMDATPITLGQEFSGYRGQVQLAMQELEKAVPGLMALAIGGSAVGTGLNTHPRWPDTVVARINSLTGLSFVPAENKFMALAGHEALLSFHGAVRVLASALFKIGNDLRWMGSGPRCGLGELKIPANEPGSSIMPGKVNPTQIEALTMVALRVLGNDQTIAMANTQGQFELNVFKPLIIYTVMESVTLLSDAIASFTRRCLDGIEAEPARLQHFVSSTLMLVTALVPHIGYDKASEAAKKAYADQTTLKQAVVALGYLDDSEFERLVVP